jgi:DNA topoisomerase-1
LRRRGSATIVRATKDLGLRLVSKADLTIRRRRRGKRWTYLDAASRRIKDPATTRRLDRLAVPPAYRDVLFAEDRAAHLQAVGRDAAGRLQYRYHPDWVKVRELRKARRLDRLAGVLPHVRRSIAQRLCSPEPDRGFACSAVIELIARSAIRPGNESYARLRGTRGAATLLKSNVKIDGSVITLRFRAKGGKSVTKQIDALPLAGALKRLGELSGRRLFQYRDQNDSLRVVTTREVNAFLREIAGVDISLKDFRTMLACASVLEALARTKPAANDRQRRKQVMQAIRIAAEELANTPAICRKSYVHATIVEAFEDGVLERFADSLKGARLSKQRARTLAKIVAE